VYDGNQSVTCCVAMSLLTLLMTGSSTVAREAGLALYTRWRLPGREGDCNLEKARRVGLLTAGAALAGRTRVRVLRTGNALAQNARLFVVVEVS
jgi:hypothetical protein